MDSPLLPSIARQQSNSRFDDDTSDLLGELAIDGDESGVGRSQQHDKQSHAVLTEPLPQQGGSATLARPSRPRFSLFARPPTEDGPGDETMMAASYRPATTEQQDEGGNDSDEEVKSLGDDEHDEETIQLGRRMENDAERDEKLRATLFELRKMNEVFEGFLGALEGVKEHNEVSRWWESGLLVANRNCSVDNGTTFVYNPATRSTNFTDLRSPGSIRIPSRTSRAHTTTGIKRTVAWNE